MNLQVERIDDRESFANGKVMGNELSLSSFTD